MWFLTLYGTLLSLKKSQKNIAKIQTLILLKLNHIVSAIKQSIRQEGELYKNISYR